MSDRRFKEHFSIIRQRNSPTEATTLEGYKVYRQEKLWVKLENRFVMCAPDDQHFIYIDPLFLKGEIGRWEFWCTCGSMAGIYGYNAYAQYASPSTRALSTTPGEMLVCRNYIEFGCHADGSK